MQEPVLHSSVKNKELLRFSQSFCRKIGFFACGQDDAFV